MRLMNTLWDPIGISFVQVKASDDQSVYLFIQLFLTDVHFYIFISNPAKKFLLRAVLLQWACVKHFSVFLLSRTFDKGTLCQLRYLLNQLTLARSKEWICLISLLCLDRDAFLRSFSMAFNWTMFSDYSEIHQNVSATDLCLKELITGLSEIKQWSHGKIPAYYYFLESCEPHMK